MLMRVILILNILACAINIFTLNLENSVGRVPLRLALNEIYFVLIAGLAFTVFLYALCVCRVLDKMTKLKYFALSIPLLIYFGFLFTTQSSHIVFYFNDAGEFVKGSMYALSYYGLVIVYLILSFICFLKHRRDINKVERATIIGFALILAAIAIMQKLYPTVIFIGFGYFLALALMYFSLEKPSEYVDGESNLLNKHAFVTYVNRKMDLKKPFSTIIFEISQLTVINGVFGYEKGNQMYLDLIKAIKKALPNEMIFRVDREAIMFITDLVHENKIIDKVNEIFQRGCVINDVEVSIASFALCLRYPEHFSDLPSQRRLSDYLYDKYAKTELVICPQRTEMAQYLRAIAVEDALQRAIKEDKLQVYFQPIHDAQGRLFSAEALVRLFDDKMGYIPASELIDTAEKKGLIEALGKAVFEKVCKFVNKYVMSGEIKLKYVSVNLSVVQCVHSGLANSFIEIMKENEVDPHYICLELTETAITNSQSIISKHMKQLQRVGVSFACDDYGTGYSTCTYLTKFPFSIVKFDSSMMRNYLSDGNVKVIMDGEADILKKLGKLITVEGVENDEQMEICRKLGVDCMQGYHFSKAIPQDKFIEYCSKQG